MRGLSSGASQDTVGTALLGGLLAASVAAWLVVDARMGGMGAGPWAELGPLGLYLGGWVLMMAAMMLPAISPMVAVFVRVQRHRARNGRPLTGGTAAFVGGYLLVWTAFGLVAYALVALVRRWEPAVLAWDAGGRWLAGAVVVAAAVYQLTPLKDACLSHCRGPMAFVLSRWRSGRVGALRMGFEHGAWCVGCCWALMAALFALGVMSLGWMLLVAAVIALEKLAPASRASTRAVAVLLLVLGALVLAAPSAVPGLPAPAKAMETDGSMTMKGD